MVIMDTVGCYTELFSDVQRPIYMSKDKVCRAVNKICGPRDFPQLLCTWPLATFIGK